jgi:catechol 2,3-dioxygenase-like lactoylglutathione lyase family enzyme
VRTKLGHVRFNVEEQNLGFYRELFAALGWRPWHDDERLLGVGDPTGSSLWFDAGVNGAVNDRHGAGFNHVAVHASARHEVDEAVAFLRGQGIELLFGTPCRRPEYESEASMYYSAMFESPDRILMEIVYIGPC